MVPHALARGRVSDDHGPRERDGHIIVRDDALQRPDRLTIAIRGPQGASLAQITLSIDEFRQFIKANQRAFLRQRKS